jgi:alpha-beta hydrolase superfamily lysophospholipase
MIGRVPRSRPVTVAHPAETAAHHGLAYSLWLPPAGVPVRGGILILHGAGSCKESHDDFARRALAAGFAALAFDQRGHGESPGPMDGCVLDDVGAMAELLRSRMGAGGGAARSGGGGDHLPVVLRGSSMGGYLALVAASLVQAAAVVAICPAGAAMLRRGLREGAFEFDADVRALDGFLSGHHLIEAVRGLEIPVLLLHAEGDERVPVDHSRELAEHFRCADSRLIVVPGGHHRSVQHDPELQAASLRFIERVVAGR